MFTFLGLVRQGDSHLPGEGVLVDGGNRTQIQVEDDGFFFSASRRAFFTFVFAASSGVRASGRAMGWEAFSW